MKAVKINKIYIPSAVADVVETLQSSGFLAYLVGGCVRDAVMNVEPKDWDIATSATPDKIQRLFPDSVYENEFGTVGVKTKSNDPALALVEVTTFRVESTYTDKRHPDRIRFAKTIEEDLSRRDFTVNALALNVAGGRAGTLLDPYGGQDDLRQKVIRAVKDSDERFGEDALRMVRAIRFACQLDFEIERGTEAAIKKNASLLKVISRERVRDEFEKIIMTRRAAWGVQQLYALGLLRHILPELEEGAGVEQNLHHIYTVWEHSLRSLEYAAKENFPLEIRLASLLHDAGKPRTKQGEGKYATFHGHEIVGSRLVRKALERLAFPRALVEEVTHLVRQHQFYYNTGELSDAGVRRFVARVGIERIDDLLRVREADRIGSGVPKAFPYKLRHLKFMVDKVRRDPISPKMLAINGNDVMRVAGIEPSPKVGMILAALLEEVLDDPTRNIGKYLEKRAAELTILPERALKDVAESSKKKQEVLEGEAVEQIKRRHKVS